MIKKISHAPALTYATLTDNFNGQGTYTYADGRKYVGEWKNGLYHGRGTKTYANGTQYVGEWKNGLYHGQGTYTDADGDTYTGKWRKDIWRSGCCSRYRNIRS